MELSEVAAVQRFLFLYHQVNAPYVWHIKDGGVEAPPHIRASVAREWRHRRAGSQGHVQELYRTCPVGAARVAAAVLCARLREPARGQRVTRALVLAPARRRLCSRRHLLHRRGLAAAVRPEALAADAGAADRVERRPRRLPRRAHLWQRQVEARLRGDGGGGGGDAATRPPRPTHTRTQSWTTRLAPLHQAIVFPPGLFHETFVPEEGNPACTASSTFQLQLPAPSGYVRAFLPSLALSHLYSEGHCRQRCGDLAETPPRLCRGSAPPTLGRDDVPPSAPVPTNAKCATRR